MRVQGELADRRKPELSAVAGELTSEKRRPSSKKNKRKQKKVGSTPSAVQRLFETCKEVFADGGAGLVPSPEDVDRLRSVLDNIDASDVGLTQNMSYFRDGASTRTLPITYLHIYECDKLSIGIFCLPPSAVIPLHNHPGMTVFSKLLFGSMHIKSYDWVNVPQNSNGIVNSLHFQPPGLHLAKVKTDSVFTAPCKTSVLYPEDGGNMHCFTARTSCAVLDVLGPPYSNPEDGRDCTYYNEFHYKSFSGDGNLAPAEDGVYAWLEEKKKPDDFFVVGAKYRGPKIIEQS
ncbi:2-aminoethanethiol dioxygenase [Musa troglodytarum]|uniref:cysteine dioxygenase n=1 Tax=Musa troglodytarum TaxID=320322 RepID=A0A9E7EY70_9LILI|nr:2-aminoethanethiol dioxygenase [Musa troglodytarum]